jgi:hypothetical protein
MKQPISAVFQRYPAIGAALLYCGLALLFFWPTWLTGAAPIPMMNTYVQGDPVWTNHRPDNLAAGTNMLLGDVHGFYYPYVAFSATELWAGRLPLWNPYTFGGIPYFAASQAAQFFPINLLTLWFGPAYYWAISAVLRLTLAGVGMFLLARRLGLQVAGALLAGGIYTFADFQITWLHFAIHNITALIPLAFWLIVRIIENPRLRRRDLLGLTALVTFQLLGGHPEMSLFFMVGCTFFGGFWLLTTEARYHRWRRLPFLIIPLVLGMALSAFQWVPTFELVTRSYTVEERSFEAERDDAIRDADYAPLGGLRHARWDNIRHWLLLVMPQLWGHPQGENGIVNWIREKTNYQEMTPYVGLAALPLVVLGLWRGQNRRAVRFFGFIFFFSLLLFYPIPGLHLIGFLPLLDVAHGFRFGASIALAAAILAGLGLDRLLRWQGTERWMVAATLLALLALNLAVLADLAWAPRERWTLGFTPNEQEAAMITALINSNNWRLWLPLAAALLFGVAVLLARLIGGRAVAALIGVALIGELWAYGFGYNGFTPPAAIYPRTAAIEQLRSDPTMPRIVNLDGTFWANSAMAHGLFVTGGMDDLKPGEQARFLRRGMAGIVPANDRHILMDWGERMLEVLGVRYTASSRPVQRGPDGEWLPVVANDGPLIVQRFDRGLPRAFAAYDARPATRRTANDEVFNARFDLWQTVVIEGDLPNNWQATRQPITPLKIVRYEPDRILINARVEHNAIVVVSDSWEAGWQVEVNGQAAQLLRTNGMTRGVAVPPGEHQIIFFYRPFIITVSGYISLIVLLLTIFTFWRWKP